MTRDRLTLCLNKHFCYCFYNKIANLIVRNAITINTLFQMSTSVACGHPENDKKCSLSSLYAAKCVITFVLAVHFCLFYNYENFKVDISSSFIITADNVLAVYVLFSFFDF